MSKKTINDLDKLVEQEQLRHTNNIIRIVAKAKALLIRGRISNEEYNKIVDKFNYKQLVNAGLDQYIENLLFYRFGLTDIYSKVIDSYSKYQTGFQKQDSFPDYESEMIEFFKFIDCYQLYKRMKDRSMIINDPKATLSVCINGGKTSYIVLKKPYINHIKPKSTTIVHEMGHAYFYHVIAGNNTHLFARDINSEIVSIFFERLYLDFLLHNTNNPDMIKLIIKNFETQFLSLTKDAKHVLEVLDKPSSDFSIKGASITYKEKGEEHNTDLYGQTYAMGNIGAARMFCEYEKNPDLFIRYFSDSIKSIQEMDFQTTLLEHTNISPLEECLSKNLVLKPKRKDN